MNFLKNYKYMLAGTSESKNIKFLSARNSEHHTVDRFTSAGTQSVKIKTVRLKSRSSKIFSSGFSSNI